MSTESLVAKFCPLCGKPLSKDRQGKVYCFNRDCHNFSVAINVALSEKELSLETTDTPFTFTNRQFDELLNQMTKSQKTAYWEELQATSHRQLIYLNEAVTVLASIEKDIRNINLPQASREQALNKLSKIASLIENRASLSCLMNQKATDVIIADRKLEAAIDRLHADNRAYQALKDEEG